MADIRLQECLGLLKELGCLAAAVLTGFLTFKSASKAFRILLLLITISLFVEVAGRYKLFGPNAAHNVYLVIDCGLQIIVASLLLKTHKAFFTSAFMLFLIAWLINILTQDIHQFASYVMVVNSVVLTLVYILVLYRITVNSVVPIRKVPAFWLCLGGILFYGCNIPYFSFFDYLNKNHLDLSAFFLHFITQTLSNLYYLLIIYCFILLARQKRTSHKSS